ncbi:MAG: hypothetical protein JST40_03820 [Armatimonadetes bacterium]|nr:hypothetical protein [Armatimonadota bacterium]
MAIEGVEPLEWTIRVGNEAAGKRVFVLIMALGAGLAGFLLLRSPLAGIAGTVLILASVSEVFLPQRFRLDSQGASAKVGLSMTNIPWQDVKRLWEDEKGVLLSPFAEKHRMNAFRGVYLRFDSNRDAVLAKIRTLWETNGTVLDRSAE